MTSLRDNGCLAAEQVYQKGEIKPLCDFIGKHYFSIFNNRDYRWANELTLKPAFMTLLQNDVIFIIDSEIEISRRYADLTMIIRPDKRYGKVFDILIEFKFISLQDAKITGTQATQLSEEDLYNLPLIKRTLQDGEGQVMKYFDIASLILAGGCSLKYDSMLSLCKANSLTGL